MQSRPYVDAVVFLGAAWADIRANVSQHPERHGQVSWASSGGLMPGGRAALSAATAKALGRQFVELVACVGDDFLGEIIKDSFRDAGVTTRLVDKIDGVPTGIRQIVTDDAGTRRTVGVSNASAHLGEHQMMRADSTLFGADMLFATLETPHDTLNRAVATAVQHKVPVVLNASPMPSPDGVIDVSRRVLANTDVLLVNWEAAVLMAGFVDLTSPSGVELCTRLVAMGPKSVVITLGEHGSIVANAHHHGLVEPYPSRAVDTSWAGDVFAGALAYGLTSQAKGNWRWEELVEAARFASGAAGLSVSRPTTLESLPTRQEVMRFITSSAQNRKSASYTFG